VSSVTSPLSRSVRRIAAVEVAAFARDSILSPSRTRPIVALTSHPRAGFPIDPDALASDLGEAADVVALETGDTTWALSEALPSRLDVYGGAARIWWPRLQTESNPFDHPLFCMFSPAEAEAARQRILAAFRRGSPPSPRHAPAPAAIRLAPTPPPPTGPICDATVVRLEGERVVVRVGGNEGAIVDADVPLARLAADVAVGQRLQVREVALAGSAGPAFSTRGIVPDAWERLSSVYRVGDVVRGRVCQIRDRYVLVEVLPGAALQVLPSELDWSPFRHPGDVVRVGERVKVKILSLDSGRRRGVGSVKQGYASEPLPAVSPAPGQPRFLEDERAGPTPAPAVAEGDAAQVLEELRSALEDRAELMRRLKEANEQIAALRKEVRSATDRLEARGDGALDPCASETAFLAAVRVEYALRFDEGSRALHPLARMRVGREFLSRLGALEGIDVAKVVEVCAQVACGRAHEVPGRAVHELRAGDAGGPGRVRAADGAKAWRCSLQDGTPSARRLHWWDVPGRNGRTIEFASVAVHDDLSIPG
jgi:predicted RNA-binding protein with RPS1 domain